MRYRSPAEKAANARMKLIQQSDDITAGISLLKSRDRASTGSRFNSHIENLLWAANLKISGLPFVLMTIGFILIVYY